MLNSNAPRRITVRWAASAGGGYTRSVPFSSQIGVQDGAASYTDGFPPLNFQPVASGGVPPFGQDMNGVLADLSGWAQWGAAGGSAQYNAAFASAVGGYPKYAVLASTTPGTFYQSTVDNNTTDPDSGGSSGWSTIIQPPGTTTGNYVQLPGGVIMQWGSVAASRSDEAVVSATLPVAFSNALYVPVVSGYLTSAANYADMWAQPIMSSRTAAGFSVQYQKSGGTNNPRLDGFTWSAFGR